MWRGGGVSLYQNKDRTKFLRLTQPEGKKNDPYYMKGLDKLIIG